MATNTTRKPVYNVYGQQIGLSPEKSLETTLERFSRMVDRKKERMINDVLCNSRYQEWELSH